MRDGHVYNLITKLTRHEFTVYLGLFTHQRKIASVKEMPPFLALLLLALLMPFWSFAQYPMESIISAVRLMPAILRGRNRSCTKVHFYNVGEGKESNPTQTP